MANGYTTIPGGFQVPMPSPKEGYKGDPTYFRGYEGGHWADVIAPDFALHGYETDRDQYGNYIQGAQGRGAPSAAYGADFRNNQLALQSMLMQDAQGKGPGQALVRMQAQQAADQAARQQFSAAQGANPSQGALAFRQAALNSAQAQSAVGGQAAQAGLQARLGAMSQLGQVTAAGRGADESVNMFNTSQIAQQRALNDQYQLGLMQQRLGLSELGQRGQLNYQDARTQRYGARSGRMAQEKANKWGALGAGLGALGQMK